MNTPRQRGRDQNNPTSWTVERDQLCSSPLDYPVTKQIMQNSLLSSSFLRHSNFISDEIRAVQCSYFYYIIKYFLPKLSTTPNSITWTISWHSLTDFCFHLFAFWCFAFCFLMSSAGVHVNTLPDIPVSKSSWRFACWPSMASLPGSSPLLATWSHEANSITPLSHPLFNIYL